MKEHEFVGRVREMARSVYENGGEAEVVIIPADTEIELETGLIDVATKGGMLVLHVETPFGKIQVVKDKWCPPNKWYLVDWLTVERIYKQVAQEFPFYSLGEQEEKVLERL